MRQKKKQRKMNNTQIRDMVGVCVGRFQTHKLHDGHLALLNNLKNHKQSVVFIGCHAVPSTKKNPLDFEARKMMVQEAVGTNTLILPIHDHPSDYAWSERMDTILSSLFPGKKVLMYDGRDGFSKWYHGKNKVEIINELPEISATKVREELSARPTEDFRAGMIYSTKLAYHRISAAVDIACYKYDEKTGEPMVLLGKKAHSPDVLRFPGGIVDVSDASYEEAAQRELEEETDIFCNPDTFQYVCSKAINDWRATPDNGYKTILYAVRYVHGEPKAKDDLCYVQWVRESERNDYKYTPEHTILLEAFWKWLEKKLACENTP
jgi:bifunctional NMN adenylyltransferase/nudix hydrolase